MKNNDIAQILDDRHEVFNPFKSQCYNCKYYKADSYSCPAFPDGILDKLLSGDISHYTVMAEQVGDAIYAPI